MRTSLGVGAGLLSRFGETERREQMVWMMSRLECKRLAFAACAAQVSGCGSDEASEADKSHSVGLV
jgi:hypothetical protein